MAKTEEDWMAEEEWKRWVEAQLHDKQVAKQWLKWPKWKAVSRSLEILLRQLWLTGGLEVWLC